MLKLKKRTIRETTAVIEVNDDDGNLVSETIRVKYYSPRVADVEAMQAEIEKAEAETEGKGKSWLSWILAKRIHSLPDLADEKGKPLEVSQEMLEEYLDIKALTAIREAIEDDLNPKSQGGR